jgi:hypothetical protein
MAVRLGRLLLADDVLDAFEDAVSLDRFARCRRRMTNLFSSRIRSCNSWRAMRRCQQVKGIATASARLATGDIASALSEYDLQHAREAYPRRRKALCGVGGIQHRTRSTETFAS